MITWQTNIRENNLTLLEALSLRLPAAPKAFLRQLCKKSRVAVAETIATAEQKVRVGENIAIKPSTRLNECLAKSRIHPARILYEDKECIVIDKPAGLAIHAARGQNDNLHDRLCDFFRLRGEKFHVAPAHRLDIGTSGAVIFGKGRAAISQLGRTMMDGQVEKRYRALVAAEIKEAGELTTSVPAKGNLKEALTRYRPITTNSGYTLLELTLVTGRRHQIRHQLAMAGWPIVGDARYRGSRAGRAVRPFLHCCHLTFPAPATGDTIHLESPLPEDLLNILEHVGFPAANDESFAE